MLLFISFNVLVLLTAKSNEAREPVEFAKSPKATLASDWATTEPSMLHSELSSRDRIPDTPADLLKKSLTENDSKRSKALLK